RDALAVPGWLDDPAIARLDDLPGRLGAHRKAAEDRPRLAGALAALEAEASEMAERTWGKGSATARLPALGAAEQARIRNLALTEAAVLQRREGTERALTELERRREVLAAALDALPAPRDAGPL